MGTTPYVGEIIMFAGNFAIQDFAPCDGRTLPVSQYQALFSILGTTYGGDGHSTFALPDLRGRAPVHESSHHAVGDTWGRERVSLTEKEMPKHTHGVEYDGSTGEAGLTVQTTGPSQSSPDSDSYLAGYAGGPNQMYTNSTGKEQEIQGVSGGGFDPSKLEIQAAGQGDAFNVQGPRMAVTFLISLNGMYPQRS